MKTLSNSPMTVAELIKAAKAWKPTPADIKAVNDEVRKISKEHEEAARLRRPTLEDLRKTFSNL